MFYTRETIDHFLFPRNFGEMKSPDVVGIASNKVCSDTVQIFLKMDGETIVECTALVRGCCAAIASASVFTGMVRGLPLRKALEITADEISSVLGGLPEGKSSCSCIAPEALMNAAHGCRRGGESPIR